MSSDRPDGSDTDGSISRWKLRALGAAGVLVLCFLLFEGAAQVYARAVLFPRWDAITSNPRHYYQASASPILAYELKPGGVIEHDGRTLHVNRWGIRDPSDDLARDRWRIGVLGDSVVFGVSHSDERTISARLQSHFDEDQVRVFSFGLGGLNLEELAEYLRLKDQIYDVHEVVFLLNPNDFARSDSVYEGTSNGLYRMYRHPAFMSRFLIRKLVYWSKKDEGTVSLRFYRWLFEGNEEWGYRQIRKMAGYCRANGIVFSVVLLPTIVAYRDDGYALSDMYGRIGRFLEEAGIRYVDPTDEFGEAPSVYFDRTNHFEDAGNVKMGEVMRDLLEGIDGVERTRRAAARSRQST